MSPARLAYHYAKQRLAELRDEQWPGEHVFIADGFAGCFATTGNDFGAETAGVRDDVLAMFWLFFSTGGSVALEAHIHHLADAQENEAEK